VPWQVSTSTVIAADYGLCCVNSRKQEKDEFESLIVHSRPISRSFHTVFNNVKHGKARYDLSSHGHHPHYPVHIGLDFRICTVCFTAISENLEPHVRNHLFIQKIVIAFIQDGLHT
jgi:hypothetical protein